MIVMITHYKIDFYIIIIYIVQNYSNMLEYQKKIDNVVEKYADMGVNIILNIQGGNNKKISNRIRDAAKERIHTLINKRIAIPYNKEFTKSENNIIYQLVTKVLLHLTHFK